MSNPNNAATQDSEYPDMPAKQTETNESVEIKVNKIVSELVKGEDGKYNLPKDLSEEMKLAVVAEKRRRDTQASYTQMSQKLKALEAEKATLIERATKDFKPTLTAEQADELEELKLNDPEAYRQKMNAYEQHAKDERLKAINTELEQVSTSTQQKSAIEQRAEILAEFIQSHKDFVINDDIIANDIPPRITRKLETGQISFEDFLEEAYQYLQTGKVIGDTVKTPKKQPNLSKVPGGTKPDESATAKDAIASYNYESY